MKRCYYKKKYEEICNEVDMLLFHISNQWEDCMGMKELDEFFLKDIREFMINNNN